VATGTWTLEIADYAKGDSGTLNSWSIEVATYRPELNNPPVADAGGPYTVVENGSVVLDASASTDPDLPYGDTLSYAWDLDEDGEFDDAFVVAPTFDATGLVAGTVVDVAVRVTDSTLNTSIDRTTVTVQAVQSELVFDSTDVPKSINDPHPRKGTPRPVTSVLTPTDLATVDLVTVNATIIDAEWDDLTVTLAHSDGGSVLLTYQGGNQWQAADSTAFQGKALDRTWMLTIADEEYNGITGTLTAWSITVTPLTEGATASSQSAAAADMALLALGEPDASEDEETDLPLQPTTTDLAPMMMK
jgi:subtilisin-like proprotein convertase family protein